MLARHTIVWPLLLVVMTLGACAHDPMVEASHIAISGNDGQLTESHITQAAPVHTAAAHGPANAQAGVHGFAKDAARAWPSYVVEPQSNASAYLLDTGDRLRIFVYGQPNLSRLYTVDQSGKISVPLIGAVRARGRSTYQLEGAIRNRLAQQFVRDPVVNIDIQQNRPFFILGEVRSAGQYAYMTGMTVEMAVATAGGYSERANERKARLSRRIDGATHVIDVSPDTEILPGDTIYVYERYF